MRLPDSLRKKVVRIVPERDALFSQSLSYFEEKDPDGTHLRVDEVSEFLQKYHKRCLDKQVVIDAVKKSVCCCKKKKCANCLKIDRASEQLGGQNGI